MIRESELPKRQVFSMEDEVRMVTSEGDSVSASLSHFAQAVVENYEGIEIEGVYESVAGAISDLLRSVGNNTEDIGTLANTVEGVQYDLSAVQSEVAGKADETDTAIASDTQSEYEDLGWQQETGVNTPSSLLNFIGKNAGVLVVSASSVSDLPETISDGRILDTHVCVKAELSNPSAQIKDWIVTTSNGSVEIDGTDAISGETDITLYLALKTN